MEKEIEEKISRSAEKADYALNKRFDKLEWCVGELYGYSKDFKKISVFSIGFSVCSLIFVLVLELIRKDRK